ncbi:MAG TPA: aspartate kinase [Bacteroidota bacterium]|nr:aspartate kinase [Bacteroidota bacterium]
MKFGGTSNKDAEAMSNVIRIVSDHRAESPFVVISAIANATNELEQAARTAARGEAASSVHILETLLGRHREIARVLIRDAARAAEVRSAFDVYLTELKTLVQGVSILRELTARTMDAFCSYGERFSSRLIAAGLQEAGLRAAWIDAKEFMVTDSNFGRAKPLMDVVCERLERIARPLLESGTIPVTQGFIGVSDTGAYTTMGRESSDFSASIIGAAMDAQRVQIWTDVDGMLTADPRMVPDVRKVKCISFEEAFELSYFGAKVLHPNTMLPLLEKNIPVEIRNSRRREGTGTRIERPLPERGSEAIVKSIAFSPEVTLITVKPRKRVNQYLFWEGAFSVLSRCGVEVRNVTTSEYRMAFTVDGKTDAGQLKNELEQFGQVELIGEQGSICLVGSGLRQSAGILNRVFSALADARISMVAFGGSDLSITVALDRAQLAGSLKALHREFFQTGRNVDVFDVPVN